MSPAKAAPATVALLAEPVNAGLVGAGLVVLPLEPPGPEEGLEVGIVPLG